MSNTWLCTFAVTIDLPTTMSAGEMERLVAQCMANQLNGLGYAGNVIVTLEATAGNVTVLTAPGNTPRVTSRINDPQAVGTLDNPASGVAAAPVPAPVAPGPPDLTVNPVADPTVPISGPTPTP